MALLQEVHCLTACVASAQTLAAVGTAGTLLYTGNRKAQGLPLNPFQKEIEAKAEAVIDVVTEATAA